MEWIDLPLSPPALVAVFAVVALGSAIQVSLGMGFGLTVAPLLALVDPILVPGPTLMIGVMTAAIGAVREQGNIVWRQVSIATLGRLFGTALAVVILSRIDDRDVFMLIFGAGILVAVIVSFAGRPLPLNASTLSLAGLLSGLMGTITSVGAPPFALIYQRESPASARPTLAAFFAIGCVVSLAGLAAAGWLQVRDFAIGGLMLAPMTVGAYAARWLTGLIDKRFRQALWLLAAVAAVILIARGLA